MSGHILLVGNDEAITERIEGLLAFDEAEVSVARGREHALAILAQKACDVVLLEARDDAGFEILRAIKAADPDVEAVVLLPGCTHELVSKVSRYGGFDFIQIPDELPFRLRPAVRRALERRSTLAQLKTLNSQGPGSSNSQKADSAAYRSIAHDVRNMISAIMGYASLIEIKSESDSPILPYAAHIQDRSRSALTLTHELRAVSQNLARSPVALNLDEVLDQLQQTLQQVMMDEATLLIEPGPVRGRISMDHALLEQLILILTSEARDLLATGGVVTFRTSTVSPPSPQSSSPECVRLEINVASTDAISPGRGTGIETVQRILSEHGGLLERDDPANGGILFRAYFPVVE